MKPETAEKMRWALEQYRRDPPAIANLSYLCEALAAFTEDVLSEEAPHGFVDNRDGRA